MSLEQWLVMVLLLLAGAASPGPSLALVSRTAIQGGIKLGLLASFGHGLAISIYAFLAVRVTAFSKSDLEQFSQIIHIIAVIFLCYLGTSMIVVGMKKKFKPAEFSENNNKAELQHQARAFTSGFLIAFLNPKVALFFLAVFNTTIPQDITLNTTWTIAFLAGLIDGGWYALVSSLVSLKAFRTILGTKTAELDIIFGIILVVAAISLITGTFGLSGENGHHF
jgi:threonine/homoserine/homoserine lactone efflux protein